MKKLRLLLAAAAVTYAPFAWGANVVPQCTGGQQLNFNPATGQFSCSAPPSSLGAYGPNAYTVGTTASAAGIGTPTVFLDIVNDSTSATIAFCFGAGCTPAINGAGSITLPPGWHRSWEGSFVPTDPVTWIASAASTPVTVGVK